MTIGGGGEMEGKGEGRGCEGEREEVHRGVSVCIQIVVRGTKEDKGEEEKEKQGRRKIDERK